LLGGPGKAESTFATLAEAVAAARDGDTIEIRGNGLLVSQPIDLRSKPLTLRAGQGFHPVLALAPEVPRTEAPLLRTQAALTLEGLEFHQDSRATIRGQLSYNQISSLRAPLAIANCRFLLKSPPTVLASAVGAEQCPSCQLRNCQFLGN